MNSMPRLLLIDDDPTTGRLIKAVFAQEAVTVSTAEDAASGLAAVRDHEPHVVVLDLRLPDASGLDMLERLQQLRPNLPIVILTGRVDVKTAVRAMQLGAFHYLTKPMDRDELVLIVRRALERRAMLEELSELRRKASPAEELTRRMGPSEAVRRAVEQATLVAATDLSVLIQGETGTGKELVAQAIHQQSPRAIKPLIAVDCGAIPDTLMESELFGHEKGAFTGAAERRHGQFQLAQHGTLFLDEIGNLPLALQPKLLRVLESREVQPVGSSKRAAIDVRIVAATNVDLSARVRAGSFREDLYYRLAQFPITLPALRDRREDIPHLARRFIAEFGLEMKCPVAAIAPDALLRLQEHDWSGNVRELRNVMRQAVVRSAGLTIEAALVDALLRPVHAAQPPAARNAVAAVGGPPLREVAERAAQAAEREAICSVLRATGGNKSVAARLLQTDYKTLHGKIRRLAMSAAEYS